MSKSKSLLDRTCVATPCTADWERMEGDEKKRFCGQCNLHVYNVSAMSRGEAEALILIEATWASWTGAGAFAIGPLAEAQDLQHDVTVLRRLSHIG